MNRLGLVLLLSCCCMLAYAQDIVVMFDDAVIYEPMVEDSIRSNADTTDYWQMDSLDVIVQDPIDSSAMTPAKSLSSSMIYYRSDVRHMRDSMRHVMRMVRDSMQNVVSNLRDSVRNDLREEAAKHPYMLRIGWGDQMFESLVWYSKPYYTLYPNAYNNVYHENYRYTQHWFLEFQRRVNYWYSIGCMVDYSGVLWDDVQRDGKGVEIHREPNHAFHNISAMITMRFTYMHSKHVWMYSGFGVGLNMNTGTETDYLNRQTVMAPAVNLTVWGMSVGNERWFGAIEFGGLYSLMSTNEIYLAGSRMFTASVGVKL